MARKELVSKGDIVLWCLAGVMAIALLLLAPKLGADTKGKILTVVMLVALFLLSIHPTVNVPWFNTKLRRCFALLALVFIISAFGKYVWPPTLAISPSKISFGKIRPINGAPQTFPFRLTNKSDEDAYIAEFDFIVDDSTEFIRDFEINVPKESRKPFGEGGIGAEHFSDITGMACHDPHERPIYILSVKHFAAHESRDVTVTYRGKNKVSLIAKAGFFTTEAQPESINGNEFNRMFRADAPLDKSGCTFFGFMVDEKEHAGMYWFGQKGGTYDRGQATH